ncbi:polysaccharide export outer membrane protein [Nonlabens xylanidelens]|uniref:Polysaccharide export outer membrane protein n=1 Tax=Nonlabens xylanidelens TaxID=191564 RepID=A0A2S6IGF5_9FLAO|nr:polysaccharide biosynthesis/export family protein [Nonlabens xylanidelens]PPK93276.1 polysaccharide export outer membrane protein [Nonlabens xylanidelens]PQJ20903.1 sugar transporter [Nonlabens xylanidelens]
MKNILIKSSLILIFVALVTSCVSKDKILYVQDIDSALTERELNYESIIKKDDILRIIVTSENMKLVQPFNQVVNPTANNDLTITSQNKLLGYLVNNEGNISFPLLGDIKAAGISRKDLTDTIQNRLRAEYVKDATVDLRVVNFKITVLGEVTRPGNYNFDYNRITLLQAIGMAGDLTIYGNRNNVTVWRDVDGVQKVHKLDLTKSDFIDSEYYYLQQNDVIIVEPNNAQVQAAGFNRNASLYVSIASVLLSLIVVLSRN